MSRTRTRRSVMAAGLAAVVALGLAACSPAAPPRGRRRRRPAQGGPVAVDVEQPVLRRAKIKNDTIEFSPDVFKNGSEQNMSDVIKSCLNDSR